MNVRAIVSLSAIAAVLVLGVGYMTIGVLHLDPRRSYLTVDLHLRNSGGLGVNAPVLLNGIQVGRTQQVHRQAEDVVVRLRIDERYRIPVSSSVRVEQLSASPTSNFPRRTTLVRISLMDSVFRPNGCTCR
ncbi:MlaD family protein [Nocardia cyriacigeorgica]|uniref:MlaD family protein n=1 Tax=Nocardia cyriacigeorgica TaxID=135487 RepID=UPI0020170C00|nr:MlaD family protein [Nocardia cyriacigeorgica]